ncbi:hypothetical protein ACSSS7_007387 [Eimeria intestinalis]
MQSPPPTRPRTEKEAALPTPATAAASQSPEQPQPNSPKGAVRSSLGTSSKVRKSQRAEFLEAGAPRLMIGKFKPSDLKYIKNAKKGPAKPKPKNAQRHKEIIYLHMGVKAFKGVRNEAWKVARGVQRLPVERGVTAPPAVLLNQMKEKLEDSPSTADIWDVLHRQPSPRTQQVTLWKDIPENEPEIPLGLKRDALYHGYPFDPGRHDCGSGGGGGHRQATEPTVGSPTPLSLGGTDDGHSEGRMTPLPSDRLRVELSPEGPVSEKGVADLFRVWLSGTERLAALLGPGQAASREFLTGGKRTGRVWSTAIVPSAPTAIAPALVSGASTQPLEQTGALAKHAADFVAQAPRLEPLREGDSPPPLPLPPPHVSPPHALALNGLAHGSASSSGNSGGESGGGSSSVEVLKAAQPAAKVTAPGGKVT